MSFSFDVKRELGQHYGADRHCHIAELSAIINSCAAIIFSENSITISISTENVIVAKKCFTLLKKAFNIVTGISVTKARQFKKSRLYSLFINSQEDAIRLLSAVGILENSNGAIINPLVVRSVCCKRAYIRGAFLACGSLSTPEKTYHLEFVCPTLDLSNELSLLINSFGLNSKVINRKGNFIVYIKESSHIVDLLNIMEAHISLMNLENVRILKDMRNNVNRSVNCETANIRKTVNAAIGQIENIAYIDQKLGLSNLSKPLEQVAKLRLSNPSASIKEIGLMLTPSVSKSCVNHRLRKLQEIAENLRSGIS